MIEIIYRDNKFLVKGTFDFGIAGIYENKTFEDDNIGFSDEVNEILDDLEEEDSEYYFILEPYFKENNIKKDKITKEILAEVFQDYYNKKELEIKQNIKRLNNYFLYRGFENYVMTGYPFWECEDILIKEELEKYDKNNLCLSCEIYNEATNNFDSLDYNIVDIEKEIRKLFPVFNLDKLISSIEPEYLFFNGPYISVQFSDTLTLHDGELPICFCSAYEEFDENLEPTDWHNF